MWKSVDDDDKEILTSEFTKEPGVELGSEYWKNKKEKLLEVTAYNEDEKVFTVKTSYMKRNRNISLKMPIFYISKELFTEFKRKENSASQVSQQKTTEVATQESAASTQDSQQETMEFETHESPTSTQVSEVPIEIATQASGESEESEDKSSGVVDLEEDEDGNFVESPAKRISDE